MIKVNKPYAIPTILKTKGKTETDLLKAQFDKATAAYFSGKEKFVFKNNIYGHKKVKQSLW